MNNINFELYRLFKIVADNKNITKASKELNISQPAITKQIKNLEEQLNTTLFDRSKDGTFLNENGKKLYNQINNSIDTLSKAQDIFTNNKKIELGIHLNIPKYMYNDSISEFYNKDKDTIINIGILMAEQLFEMLDKDKIDIALSKRYEELEHNYKNLTFIPIKKLTDTFIVRKDSKYINISKEELKNNNIYTLKKFSKTYNNLVTSLNYDESQLNNIKNVTYSSIIDLLKSRDIIAYVTKEYTKEIMDEYNLKYLNIDMVSNKEDYGFYIKQNNISSRNIKLLIEVFKNNS